MLWRKICKITTSMISIHKSLENVVHLQTVKYQALITKIMQHYIIKLNVASSSAKHRWQELWDQHFPHVFLQPRRILKERAQKFLILWHPPIFTLPLSSHLFPQQLPQVALHTFWTHLLFLHFPFFHWFLHLALPNLFLQTVCAPVWYKTYSPPISKLKPTHI